MTTRRQFFMETHKASEGEISYLQEVDPSGKRWAWLLRGARAGWFKFVPVPELQEALKRFNRLSQSPRFREANYHPDLNSYTWEALGRTLERESELKSNKQRAMEFEGAKLLWADKDFAVYKILTPLGAELAGSGSNWCTTASQDTAQVYLQDGPLYIAHIWGHPYAQIHPERMEWNLAANIVTKQDIYNTEVWMDPVGHQIFTKAAKAAKDFKLLKALEALPLVSIQNPGQTRLAAILNPMERLSRHAERELIKEQELPGGYFRRLRKQRDPELESYLSSRGDPQACMEYVECVSNEVPQKMVDRIADNTACHAKYINRVYPTTFKFTKGQRNLLRQWMDLTPSQLNPSALKLLNLVDVERALTYLERCHTTSPTWHYQLISQRGDRLETLFEYEKRILGGLQPQTIKALQKLAQDCQQGLKRATGTQQTMMARLWVDCPELRSQIPLQGLSGVRTAIDRLEGYSADIEQAILDLDNMDFDHSEFRSYVQRAIPIRSDLAVLKMACRPNGNSVAGPSLDLYLQKYPAGPEKRAFVYTLLHAGLTHSNDNLMRTAIHRKALNSKDIVRALLENRKPSSKLWHLLVSRVGVTRVIAGVAMRLKAMNIFPKQKWSGCAQWNVSSHAKRFLAPLSTDPEAETSLIWVAHSSEFLGFSPTAHPDLARAASFNMVDLALDYVIKWQDHATETLPAINSAIEWLGWGLYTLKDDTWSRS